MIQFRVALFICVQVMLCGQMLSISTVNAEELSQHTARQVQRAYELQLDDKLQNAIDVLMSREPSRSYDKAYVTRMLADILLSDGQYEKSVTRYQTLLAQYSDAKDLQLVWLRISQALYQQQKWQETESAINKHQQYLKQAKLSIATTSLKMLLVAQIQQQKWYVAIPTAYTLRDREPNNSLWWHQLVSLYLYIENSGQALVTIQQADRAGIELSEQHLLLMAQLYGQLGVPFKAAHTYERLKNLPSRVSWLEQQALYWQAAKEWKQAERSWSRAAKIDKSYYWQHALLSLQQREYQQAIISLDKIPKQTAEVLLAKVQALNAMGDKKQALQMATTVHKRKPSSESLSWIKFLK